MINPVGVITRAIAVIAGAIVLGLTLWKTLFIFQVEKVKWYDSPFDDKLSLTDF